MRQMRCGVPDRRCSRRGSARCSLPRRRTRARRSRTSIGAWPPVRQLPPRCLSLLFVRARLGAGVGRAWGLGAALGAAGAAGAAWWLGAAWAWGLAAARV